ncbi:MAG: glycosyltransferase, partial [Chloroflexi bacterium]
ARLLAQHPDWKERLQVVLVGGEDETQPDRWNSEQRRLDALRHELRLTAHVIFAGAQPQDRLPLYYTAADVVAAPSHYESFGLAALEALACGAAVVASNVGGLALTIEDRRSGLLCPPDDDAALAAQIERILTDAALAARLRSGAVQRAAEYGWPAVARRIIALYDELLQVHAVFWSERRLVRVS